MLAATVAFVLVPVALDPDLLATDPTKAYYWPELRVLLAVAVALLVAMAGVLLLGDRPVLVAVLVPALALLGVSALSAFFSERPIYSLYGDRGQGLPSLAAGILLFYALAQCLTFGRREHLFLPVAATTAALVSIYGIAQNYGVDLISGWRNPPFTDPSRSFATIGNTLTLAS